MDKLWNTATILKKSILHVEFHLSLFHASEKNHTQIFFPKGNGSHSKVPESVPILAKVQSAQLDIFGPKPY